jgi:uncharacterized protein YbaA (DUF1428 family)
MSYVDGFVIPVPASSREAYREVAVRAAPVFKEYGAIRIMECWADDLPDGEVIDFKTAVKAERGETVVFSWILWPSKAVRDEANKKIMTDPRLAGDMPFDGKRLVYGGFQILLDTGE